MAKLALIIAIALSGSFSWAYRDGVYPCKNMDGLPNNVYKIETIEIREGLSLPFIEATRHFQAPDKSVREATIKGFATHANHNLEGEPAEMLSVGAIRLEFRGDTFVNCQAP